VPLADDLLAQADDLATKEAGIPIQASLRRAISAAYYARFHLLGSAGARTMAPVNPARLQGRVQRAFVHGDMKKVCEQFQHGRVNNISEKIRDLLSNPIEPELVTISKAFVELQVARDIADYNVLATFDRVNVLQKIQMAQNAFAAWDAVKHKPNSTVFLSALLLLKHLREA
jgi:hypothetical protein